MKKLAHVAGVLTLTAGLLTAVFAGSASACSCPPGGEGEKFQRADHVFSGLVLAKVLEAGDPSTSLDDLNRFVLLVGTEYKGRVPRVVSVTSAVQGATCGVEMLERRRYVVFATGDAADRRVEATLCGGTRLADSGPPVTTTSTPVTTTCATATS
ncbi:hypothetical protein [Umezawaea sp. NPDC059074]|uniref:hypothetical protein n=1 Tax=Umezawaea sp. NPDC059074 TaxID=3346716 RepID=UPI0036981A2F